MFDAINKVTTFINTNKDVNPLPQAATRVTMPLLIEIWSKDPGIINDAIKFDSLTILALAT